MFSLFYVLPDARVYFLLLTIPVDYICRLQCPLLLSFELTTRSRPKCFASFTTEHDRLPRPLPRKPERLRQKAVTSHTITETTNLNRNLSKRDGHLFALLLRGKTLAAARVDLNAGGPFLGHFHFSFCFFPQKPFKHRTIIAVPLRSYKSYKKSESS